VPPTFDLKPVLELMKFGLTFPPAVIGWNRLEGRPRTEQFDRALRAEVRDALWFLTRQWQFGEFAGEDAGSPVDVRTAVRVEPLQHYAVQGQEANAVAYDSAVSLETHVERETIPFDLMLHAQLTRYLWRLIASVPNQAAIRAAYLAAFPLVPAAVTIAGVEDDDARHALQAGGAAVMDTAKLLAAIATGTYDPTIDGFAAVVPLAANRARLKQAGRDLATWFGSQFSQPTSPTDDAWKPPVLEYQFAVATETSDRGQSVFIADQYTQGHLDWYDFDVDATPGAHLARGDGSVVTPTVVTAKPLSFVPTPVSFAGMPSPRYWEMESRQIEFAGIDAHTTDVAKLLLTEFALIYGNDWCVIPYELPIGTVSEVRGMLVTDDFGEQSLLLPAGRGRADQWQRWSMFTMSRSPATSSEDTRFFFPPAVGKLIEASPLEKVLFLRDEMANMAWAVERVVPSRLGAGINGYDVAARAAGLAPIPPPLHATTAPVRYVLGTDVPYNWIPFIPVRMPGSTRSVQLQRAQMPPVAGVKRERYTRILGVPGKYYLHEEEVPRAGKIATRGYQRARWWNGATLTWIGRRVTTGRGEGSSGLAFDQITDVPRT
jgi:hypothetical protein